MKKVSTTVIRKGKVKTVSVWLDERTITALEQANDEELMRQYILDEHNSKLIELKETRRHQSLDMTIENGFEIADEHYCEDDVFANMDATQLRAALCELTPDQRKLIYRVYFLCESQKDIANELGVDKTSIRDRLKTIYKKIKRFFEK